MMGSDMEIPDELIDQLMGEYQGPEQLTGPDGLINQLRKRLIERAAGAELERHLGYPQGAEAPEVQPNRRNGMSSKTLRTVDGPVTVELPRDRDASFEPQVVPKHTRSFDAFDDQILALYAGGMTTRDIQRHLSDLYGVQVSDGLISEVTASIQDDVRAWQSRPLEELYAVVYLDALQVSIRDQQVVRKKAVYIAVGVTMDGERDCLGPLDRQDRGRPLLDERAHRAQKPGCQGHPVCLHRRADRVPRRDRRRVPASGQPDVCCPSVRQSLRYLSWKERRSCASELRRIYTAPDADAARQVLDELTAAWAEQQNPHRRPPGLGTLLGPHDPRSSPSPKRSAVSSTPPTPSRASTCRSAKRSRPADTSPTTTPHSGSSGSRSCAPKPHGATAYNWTQAHAVLRIHFGDRIPDNT